MSEMDFKTAQAQAQLTKSTEPLVWPIVVYVLYLVSMLLVITWFIAVIIAHVKASDADAVSLTHYRYQIRTFWISLPPTIIGLALLFVFIGWIILIPVGIWCLVREIKGLLYAIDRKPMPNPTTWLW